MAPLAVVSPSDSGEAVGAADDEVPAVVGFQPQLEQVTLRVRTAWTSAVIPEGLHRFMGKEFGRTL